MSPLPRVGLLQGCTRSRMFPSPTHRLRLYFSADPHELFLMHPTKESLVTLVARACQGHVALPEFQRSFIWERRAVEELLVSIFNEYFIGSLLTLTVSPDSIPFRARAIEGIENDVPIRPDKMVLDGQQRITSIYYALYGPDISLKSTSYPYRFFLDTKAAVDGRWDDAIVSLSTARRYVRPLFEDPAKAIREEVRGSKRAAWLGELDAMVRGLPGLSQESGRL